MRALIATATLWILLAGCAAGPVAGPVAGPAAGPHAACTAQGYAPGTEEYRICMDAGGAEIATGPGSPYANADEEEDGL